ncbi:Holliday junction resolvase RecU [Sporosarcina koreensis]|uniref:Holliday junction resolvase RecU n=1 Tax=Sporosarcina koreensis TaxID=334735 RepID=UPI00128FA7BB
MYLLAIKTLETYWEDAEKGGRKSIPHSTFLMECDRVKSDKGYVLHYLKHVG